MRTLTHRRVVVCVIVLVGAGLACARAEAPITPANPQILSPRAVVARSETPAEAAPTDTPKPEATPTEEFPAETVEPTLTSEPSDTPIPSPTSTNTLTPTSTPTSGPPTATFTPIRLPTATPQGPFSTRTPTSPPVSPTKTKVGPTPTKTPTLVKTPTPGPTVGSTPGGVLPPGSTLTQNVTVSYEGGTLFGRPQDMIDGRTTTWASLRGGNASWIFNLGSSRNVDGIRLYAHSDGGDPTTLLAIEVSTDGSAWTAVYTGEGNCGGVPNCDTIQQEQYVDFAFGPVSVQFVRLRGGPTRFAFAEVLIALSP